MDALSEEPGFPFYPQNANLAREKWTHFATPIAVHQAYQHSYIEVYH
jgi:hypothetical protein